MTTTFKVIFSEDAELNFELIFNFLFESYLSFDEDIETAIKQAEKKTQSIRKATDKLAKHPFRGTLHDDMLQGLRHITMGRAIYWFDVIENEQLVRILAIFYGSQDHHTKMLTRLLGGGVFTTTNISLHPRTNMDIIKRFLDVDIQLSQCGRKCWQVAVSV